MNIFRTRLKDESHGREPAQAIRNGRPSSGNPNCVGYRDRVRSEVCRFLLHEVFKIWAADLLFKLPNKLNIDGGSLLQGITCAEERGQRRTFVIRRAATDVAV